jgi:nucleotide-binding universal stress UspA family protein
MRILVAADDTGSSKTAVKLGARIARDPGNTLALVTVVEHESERAAAEKYLTRTASLTGLEADSVQTIVRTGNPAKEVLQEAEEGRYDLLILGSKTEHDLLTRLLGTTTETVIAHAPCPVLIAKTDPSPIRRILVCVTNVDMPSHNVLFTERFVEELREPPEITILHVMSQISAGHETPDEWQLYAGAAELIEENLPEGQLLQADLEAMESSPARVKPRIRHGAVVEEIMAEAQEGDYDLIVIGAHHASGLQRFLLEDLARLIVTQADRSVLVV